jgi:aspartate kinase
VIVLKFGGTSVADAERILGVAAIVKARASRRPVVVVSALAGVTDLLVRAVAGARAGDREGIEPLLSDLARRHRWAISGAIEPAGARHDLTLQIDGMLEDLRQLLRSVRLLGEGTPRASDTLLAFGELMSSRIVAAAFRASGLPSRWVDPREVVVTDDRHGAATADVEATSVRAKALLVDALDAGEVPVVGGFVGSTREGHTTTLGRGGSDTSAAILGAALGAAEIQIWTDVDGILSADPRVCPGALVRERVAFAEAAELAFYGAKVLHPAAIAPAVARGIPVRVLNSLRPDGAGTVVLAEAGEGAPPLVAVASRGGATLVRLRSRRMRIDAGFLPGALAALEAEGVVPDLVVSSEVGVAAAVAGSVDAARLATSAGEGIEVEVHPSQGIVCIVGSGLATDARIRGRVLAALAEHDPALVSMGGSGTSVSALVAQGRLADTVRALHHTFFEGGAE